MATSERDNARGGYRVLSNSDLKRLEQQVADYIASGWTPVGNVVVDHKPDVDYGGKRIYFTSYFQAVWFRN